MTNTLSVLSSETERKQVVIADLPTKLLHPLPRNFSYEKFNTAIIKEQVMVNDIGLVPVNGTDKITLPLYLQIAERMVKKYNIRSVKKTETSKTEPYFYSTNKYVEDKDYERLKGFITAEIVDIFNSNSTQDDADKGFVIRNDYIVPNSDMSKYRRSVNYVNILRKNVIEGIATIIPIRVSDDDFDDEDYSINTRNGYLNLKTGILEELTPQKLIKSVVNAKYAGPLFDLANKDLLTILDIPNIRENLFIKYLMESLYVKDFNETENKKRVLSFLVILSTYLIGNNKLKIVTIIIGEPDTGKSTFFDVLKYIFGDYLSPFNKSVITTSYRGAKEIRPDIIALRGKRILTSSETDETDKFDTATVKAIAGNDNLSYRKPHSGKMVDFKIKGKLLLGTNFCPTFSNLKDEAFLNRIILIDFKNKPPVLDRNLYEKMTSEENCNFIFSLLADVAKYVISKDYTFIAESFKANKRHILINQPNSVARFFKEQIRPHDYYWPANTLVKHPVSLLYSALYVPFCKRNSVDHIPLNVFGKVFKEIADEYNTITWHEGHTKNYFRGFDVIGENTFNYFGLIANDFQSETYNWGLRYTNPES